VVSQKVFFRLAEGSRCFPDEAVETKVVKPEASLRLIVVSGGYIIWKRQGKVIICLCELLSPVAHVFYSLPKNNRRQRNHNSCPFEEAFPSVIITEERSAGFGVRKKEGSAGYEIRIF